MKLGIAVLAAACFACAAPAPPTIANFIATPAQLVAGQSGTLSWSVAGATAVRIEPGLGTVPGNWIAVSPKTTTTYTLTASNSGGSATATVTITVGAPVISSFTATPAQIPSGQIATLAWTATGATTLAISPGVGTVTGNSIQIRPKATTTYTLTATNAAGARSATATVTLGNPPAILSFGATPLRITPGQAATLTWVSTGATSLRIDPAPGAVTGNALIVKPVTTTSYTLTAANPFGSATARAIVTVGSPPSITSFTASPAKLTAGQPTTLAWNVTGAQSIVVSPGVGLTLGTSIKVTPTTSTTYTLTATNAYGTATATVAASVSAGTPPVINGFVANPSTAGPGIPATLRWLVTGATTVSIDHGVGAVAGSSVDVVPSGPVTYTLTASNAAGSTTATAAVGYIPLTRVSNSLFYSEHALFVIPNSSQVTWTGSQSWNSVYSTANVNSYVASLKSLFPADYFFVVVTANNLTPNNVPSVLTYRHMADGIGMGTVQGVGIPNICRYNIGGGTVVEGSYGVLDHEIGHNWGVFIGSEVASPHWLPNSTAYGQMADVYSDDGYTTIKQITGDPVSGFAWKAADNIQKNETETFSLHDLYLMGLNPSFPDLYVLTSPVYKPDHTVSYSSVARYDQFWVVQKNGMRVPDYRQSEKRLKMAFIYVARDSAEVLASYQPIERSIDSFVNGEQIDIKKFRFQVPFLVETLYRASVDARLADLDGNRTPLLTLTGSPAVVSNDGSATVGFSASDPDGPAPTVSCVPNTANCTVQGKNVVLTGLPRGANFVTIKAQDSGGKKAFAHFVVEVP